MLKKKKVAIGDAIEEKLRYIGLDLDDIPEDLLQIHKLNFRVLKGYNEKKYKQYRYINVSDIDILLTPAHRLTDLKEKYEKARPLYAYLDSKDEENMTRRITFTNMLKKVEISDIQRIEKEQEQLSKKLPFKIKYNRNYLWQIYYSEYANRYFMLVPTEESEQATFFYLLKKKIENKKDDKIFVPISYVDYSDKVLKKSELKDMESYLWMFTKDYPSIYEVYDKKDTPTIQIIGESQIYGKIKTLYKITFSNTKEASKFYKLLKALFILQTELPHYYSFTTNIEEDGKLNICLENTKIEYDNLLEFVLEQYIKSVSLKQKVQEEVENLEAKLGALKSESTMLESEYFAKEKQISTYLECKKSFFGKVKYYFKFGKSGKKSKKETEEDSEKFYSNMVEDKENKMKHSKSKYKVENRRYTLEELIISYKELEILETNQKNTILDINAIKLKNKNLKKKIENATAYINEINEHKRSIFEFWKYSNKDEVKSLDEGEQEELNVVKREKTFDYDNDFEKFGENTDKFQRLKFSDSELDSAFVASTKLIDIINKTYEKQVEAKDFSATLKELKENSKDDDDFDVFGKSDDNTKERNIGNKIHRETLRNVNEILDIKKGSRGIELKKSIVNVIKDLRRAIKKQALVEDMYVYKAINDELDLDGFQALSLNEEAELNEYLIENKAKRKNKLYRIKLPKGTNYIAFSNIVYYNNQNMTLPVGMQKSNRILVDLSSLDIEEVDTRRIGKIYLDDDKNDFSKTIIKAIEVHELDGKKVDEKSNEKNEE